MSDWSKLFGTPNFDKFDEHQRRELLIGISEDLPYQLYADPKLSAFEMKEFRVLLSRSSLVREGPDAVIKEGMQPGFISVANYKAHPDEVCYIPENWDMEEDGAGYTANDILKLCNGDKDLADMVFGLCDWQHPSTVLDEMDTDDTLALLEIKKEKLKALQDEISELEKSLDPDLLSGILYISVKTPAQDAVLESLSLKLRSGIPVPIDWITSSYNYDKRHGYLSIKCTDVSVDGMALESHINHIGKLDGAALLKAEFFSETMPGAKFQVTELEFLNSNNSCLRFEVENGNLKNVSAEKWYEDPRRYDLAEADELPFLDRIIEKAEGKRQAQTITKDTKGKESMDR